MMQLFPAPIDAVKQCHAVGCFGKLLFDGSYFQQVANLIVMAAPFGMYCAPNGGEEDYRERG